MMEVLNTIDGLANEQKNKEVMEYVAVVKKAISNIENLSSSYAKGFINKSDYVMLEYNTYVYTCIEATSSLLYEFVEYIKRPDQQVMTIQLKNTNIEQISIILINLINSIALILKWVWIIVS